MQIEYDDHRYDGFEELELAWIAGVIEGEGSLTITNYGKGIRVSAGNTDPTMIEPLLKYGGGVYNNRPGWHEWHIQGTPAQEFLELILPFIRSHRKRKLAGLLLSFPINKGRGVYHLTESQIDARLIIGKAVKHLNRRGRTWKKTIGR